MFRNSENKLHISWNPFIGKGAFAISNSARIETADTGWNAHYFMLILFFEFEGPLSALTYSLLLVCGGGHSNAIYTSLL